MKRFTYGCLLVAAVCGCKKNDSTPTVAGSGSAPAAGSGSAAVATGSGSSGSGSAGSGSAGSGSAAADPLAKVNPGTLATPESVYYDEGRDMYMISNINGKPADADDNGFITVVNPDGDDSRAAANVKWINGEMGDIKLDAPKGMAISDGTLYVADITVVRRFDAKSGKQKDDIKIAGSTFLNDIVADGAGGVFVSDTGVDASFKPTGADAVYHITKDGKATPLIKNKDLGGPNGVALGDKGSVWVVTFRSGEVYSVDAKGKKGPATKLPKGQLDGIIAMEGGDLLISSWEGKCVYRGKPGGEWKEIASDVESPADIGYDSKRKRLLIPLFTKDKLVIKQL
jgi:hypothetical protein